MHKLLSACLLLVTLFASATAQDVQEKTSVPDGAPKSLEGLWSGTLKTGAIDLRLVFKIARKGDDWSGTMDSIDQSTTGIPIEVIEHKDGNVKLELKSIKGVFEGKLKEDGSEVIGRWKQRGGDLALTLNRTDKVPEIIRPQNPQKPYPYDEHEVTYTSLQDGIKLAGTLTVPRGDGPFPAVVILSGSGPQNRDGMIFNHKLFLVIADHLTRHGIAVLRVDDRGVGGSSGDDMKATYEDCQQDVLAGIVHLKSRKEIDAAKIGLIGHSEGGVLAPYVAARSQDVAFMVMLAGTGLTGEEILYLQGQAILKVMGAGEAAMKKQRELQELLFSAIKVESGNDGVNKLIQERLAEYKAKLSPLEQVLFEAQKKSLEAQVETITTPWFRCFLAHDPRADLRKIRIPVLALIGEKDVQVSPKENLDEIGKALAEGGNKNCTLKEMSGLNHLFQTAKTGAIVEYGQIEETFAPAALEIMTEWILSQTK